MKLRSEVLSLQESYIFSWCAQQSRQYAALHPEARLLGLGIGDVTAPLCAPVAAALLQAVKEQTRSETFRGYAPAEGYDFLRTAIAKDYARRGICVQARDIFITDGAKDTLADLCRLLPAGLRAALPAPCYPVYRDLLSLLGAEITECTADAAGSFPMPPQQPFDLCILCSPDNPTGRLLSRECAAAWVQAAQRWGALVLFDAAYEAYVRDADALRSIYEVAGAESCAIEIASLSKTAGFTGLRCGHLVIPRALQSGGVSVQAVWQRLLASCSNGVAYIVQRAAEAAYSVQGRAACTAQTDRYLQSAAIIAAALPAGRTFFSGSSPYVWFRCGEDSRLFFSRLLQRHEIVCTPGIGFGAAGEGFVRFSGFCGEETAKIAANRLQHSAAFFSLA
ncbi:MAG: LL-diaminopimelate aminotransferase [Oscillospiraceae bacterium]|nr:LL-diaminopimelate aminotransferase [Oscillospiraceae bacterium]